MTYQYRTKIVRLKGGTANVPDLDGWKIAWVDHTEVGWAFAVYRKKRVPRIRVAREAAKVTP